MSLGSVPPRRLPKEGRAPQYANPTFVALRGFIAENLRRIRTARGWTQEEAADRCGMVFQTYQPIEAGKVNVTLVTIARLADGLQVTPDDVLLSGPAGEAMDRARAIVLADERLREQLRKGQSGPRRKKTARRARAK